MLAGVRQQAEWLRHGPREIWAEASKLGAAKPPRVYLAGCGDSHYAGVAARHAFEAWSGIPTQALPSLEFSRYEVEHAPPGSWVVCVSNSGKVTRTVEAATRARERGLFAVAVTYDPGSRLALSADFTLAYRYDDPGFGPGTISYVASLSALYVLAARLGRGDADPRLAGLEGQADAVAQTIELANPVAERLARETPVDAKIDVVGGGPSLGTALFGRAKLIEAAQAAGGAHELEEWAHEEFFCTAPGTRTIVLAPPGASADRALEQLEAARAMGATAVAVCPPDATAAAGADVVLPVAGDPPEELSPFAYCVPLELFAYHFASSRGLTMLGFDDEHRRQVNFRQIFGAQ